jgi:hypothetical protein
MNLLLDTHTFLWFMEGNERISQRARAEIEAAGGVRALTVASAWEMGVQEGFRRIRRRATLVGAGGLRGTNTTGEVVPLPAPTKANDRLPVSKGGGR